MQPSKYKFYINGTEVYPHYKSLTKKYEKENNQMFFREKLEGDIKLYGADYFLIKNSSLYTEHTLLIQKESAGQYKDYFTGTFGKTDCEFDIDKRACKLNVSPKDLYSNIVDNYDNEYNLVDLAPALTSVTVSKRPILQVYVLEDNIINNFLPNGVTWETQVEADMSLNDLYEKGHFSLDSRHIEISIESDSVYNGVYTGAGWVGATLVSPTNSDYMISGYITLAGNSYECSFNLYKASDTMLSNPLYITGTVSSPSRFATLTFYNPSNKADSFIASASMETVLMRALSGFSVTRDGNTAIGELAEGDFGYIDNYSYVYGTLQMAYTVVAPANSSAPTPYGKAKNGYYYSMPFADSGRFYPFAKSTWNYSSRWIYLTIGLNNFDKYGSVYNDIKDCIHIADAIKALLKKVAPDIMHEATPEYSQFLYGPANPIYGDKFELFITQKTHIKKFFYDTPATKVPITLEKVMNMLAKCFRCYCYIEDNKFKIEHLSFFENGKNYDSANQIVGLDITALYDNKNGRPLGYGQNAIKYNKNSLPSRYEFSYMDKSSIEFEGSAIKLTAPYLQQDKTESINVEDFSADLDMLISNTVAMSDDGFALIAAKAYTSDGVTYYSTFKYDLELISIEGYTYKVSLQNGVLSWFYLFNFYRTSLPTSVVEYDEGPKQIIRVTGITKCMIQEVKVPVEEDPALYELVTTDIGNGQINSLSIDLTSKQATIELLYEPE